MNLLMQMAYVQTVGIDAVTPEFQRHDSAADRSRLRGWFGRLFRSLADRVDPEPAPATGC